MGLSPASHMLPSVLKICISVASFCVQLQSFVFAVVGCCSVPLRLHSDDYTLHYGVTNQECQQYPQIVCLTTELRVLSALVLWHSASRPAWFKSRPYSTCSANFCLDLPIQADVG
jgi:hypothetical protein